MSDAEGWDFGEPSASELRAMSDEELDAYLARVDELRAQLRKTSERDAEQTERLRREHE